MVCSIFIASRIMSAWPLATSASPSPAITFTTRPGMSAVEARIGKRIRGLVVERIHQLQLVAAARCGDRETLARRATRAK